MNKPSRENSDPFHGWADELATNLVFIAEDLEEHNPVFAARLVEEALLVIFHCKLGIPTDDICHIDISSHIYIEYDGRPSMIAFLEEQMIPEETGRSWDLSCIDSFQLNRHIFHYRYNLPGHESRLLFPSKKGCVRTPDDIKDQVYMALQRDTDDIDEKATAWIGENYREI